jgi:hypothetical protein
MSEAARTCERCGWIPPSALFGTTPSKIKGWIGLYHITDQFSAEGSQLIVECKAGHPDREEAE